MASDSSKKDIQNAHRDRTSFPSSSKKRIVVFTNGVYDILHPGHCYLLHQARKLGTKLIVGIDSDQHVATLGKKPKRPINPEDYRKFVLQHVKGVDRVYIFDDLLDLIKRIKPDILVKGGDYLPDQIIGSKFVKSYGGKVVILPYLEGFSTTKLIHRIWDLNKAKDKYL